VHYDSVAPDNNSSSSSSSSTDASLSVKIFWRRHGKQIAVGRNAQRQRIGVNRRGVLRVRHARLSDAGEYSCSLGDERGHSVSTVIKFHSIDEATVISAAREAGISDNGRKMAAERVKKLAASVGPFEHHRGGDLAGGSYSVRHLAGAMVSRSHNHLVFGND
jgi:hypothetical protein